MALQGSLCPVCQLSMKLLGDLRENMQEKNRFIITIIRICGECQPMVKLGILEIPKVITIEHSELPSKCNYHPECLNHKPVVN